MGFWSAIMGKSKVRTLSAQISADDHKRYTAIAKASNKTLSSWVNETLAALYPADLYPKNNPLGPGTAKDPRAYTPAVIDLPSVQAAKSVMGVGNVEIRDEAMALEEALFASVAAADAQERSIYGSFGQDPAPTPTVAVTPQQAAPGAPSPHGQHVCAHLSSELPRNHTWVDCQGSCRAQHGRPCHWPSQSASQCPTFRRRYIPIVP